ncbi:NAD-dependent epimerase/dehydratase family protein [Propionivibrio sp.]|uniref:NAD-dependent epimerase/dehydratase family protein n=1 Tax=Propionivibrio sp. TaxID=2212460 RepID=UPI00261B20B9|nr:NAD-dependent epimerase/dehydratase family protein [Propionivibrio sp.]
MLNISNVKFTVLGSAGFIGRNLVASLESLGALVYAPTRDGDELFSQIFRNDLGHVIYCIGLTADFRHRPFETVDAHVCFLRKVLERGCFESLTYLSSTRVYEGASTTLETGVLQGAPGNPEQLYNFSKLMGESLCLNCGRRAKVVRLSNVYGPGMGKENFLSLVLSEAASTGRVHFLTSPESSKDFISVKEVVRFLPSIAMDGQQAIYNLASGLNTTNAEIASALRKEGITVTFSALSPEWVFPVIDIKRLESEFIVSTRRLEIDFPDLLNYFRSKVVCE